MTEAYNEHSKHLRHKDLQDRDEKKSARERGIVLRPRYRDALGDTPLLDPGDVKGAALYLQKIRAVIGQGGWTRDERNRLKRIKRKWQRKADGLDQWFMENGNPMTGEEGNAYGREGFRQQQKRDKVRAAIDEINREYERRKDPAARVLDRSGSRGETETEEAQGE